MTSRRTVLGYAVGGAVIAFTPVNVRAIDPLTAMQAASALAGVISAINQAGTNAGLLRGMAQINYKLDQILLNQAIIIKQIEDLKLYTDRAVWEGFKSSSQFDVLSLRTRYNRLIAKSGSNNTGALEDLADELSGRTSKVGFYDFGAFVVFATGAAMELYLRGLLKTSLTELRIIKDGFRDVLRIWLDENNPLSVTFAIRHQASAQSVREAELAAFPREIVLAEYRADTTENGKKANCRIRETLKIEGNLQSGFTASVSKSVWDCNSIRENDPADVGNPGCRSCDATIFGQNLVEDAPDYSGIPAAAALNSQYAGLNEINRIRNEIISMMRRARDLDYWSRQISKAEQGFA